jgi:hypothetical protein
MPQFKIYAAEVTQFGPVGVVIVTAFNNSGGYPRAESFLLIPDKKTVFSQKLQFDVKSFDDSSVELTEEFMVGEALQRAKINLGLYLQDRDRAGAYPPPPNSPNVLPDTIDLLVRVWIRGTCPHLNEVFKKTEYEPLRDAIRPILNLPVIKVKKL